MSFLKYGLLVSISLCILTACGQKGPLYLPTDNHPTHAQQESTHAPASVH